MNWIAVFIGGGIGSLLRFGVSSWAKTWPISSVSGTFISNVLASVVLALVTFGFIKNLRPDSAMYLFIAVGVCGGFSTFSTFSMENVELMKTGHPYAALINIVVNVGVCFFLIWVISKRA